MMTFKQRRDEGFTLIEIIIVVVILGILAAIALPKVTENIDKARAAEAFGVASAIGKAVERCLADETGGGRTPTSGDESLCNTYGEIRMADPNSTNFTYILSNPALNAMRLLSQLKPGVAADIIDFTFNTSTGVTTRGCGGTFSKMCK